MSIVAGKLRHLNDTLVAFFCPGCKELHQVNIDRSKPSPGWTFNGNAESPTFRPSVLVKSGHYITGDKNADTCWCDCPESEFHCKQCHSYVTDGKIQFLSDCSHELAGQTVELPDISTIGDTNENE